MIFMLIFNISYIVAKQPASPDVIIIDEVSRTLGDEVVDAIAEPLFR